MVIGTDLPDSTHKWFWLTITVLAALTIWTSSVALANETELAVREKIVFDLNADQNEQIDINREKLNLLQTQIIENQKTVLQELIIIKCKLDIC